MRRTTSMEVDSQQIEQRNDFIAFKDEIRLPAANCATIAAVEQDLQRGCYACEVEHNQSVGLNCLT